MLWLEILRAKVEHQGRRYVCEKLGISSTTLSQVLNEKYPGNLDNIRTKVTAAFGITLAQTVVCPVLGEIGTERCRTEQQKPFTATNPTRVKLWQNCRACPNNCQGK
ncbi:helix-turn-helix transcriptional regulator [Rheinheimera sp.]|uniref:helix-turn-helix domain-containing protein n=1 Tax=Rheinheimera sp. TaxID=1869214 RepID=UPI00307D2E7A